MDIRSGRQKGRIYTEIARKYNIEPGTAKKYAGSETRPAYSLSAAKPSKPDPYKEQVTIWLEEAPFSAERFRKRSGSRASTAGAALTRNKQDGRLCLPSRRFCSMCVSPR